MRGMPESLARKHGEELLALIHTAHGDVQPEPRLERLTAQEDALVDALMTVAHIKAAATGVSPAQLVTRSDLEQLVRGNRDLEILQGWRLETAGRALLEFLEGKIILAVKDGALEIQAQKL